MNKNIRIAENTKLKLDYFRTLLQEIYPNQIWHKSSYDDLINDLLTDGIGQLEQLKHLKLEKEKI
jgi:hypothetical protein